MLRVELGGALGTIKDKIFGSYANHGDSHNTSMVKGLTRKGKVFLEFDTNLTEKIRSMAITGSHLLVAGDHVYNHYLDCRDANYYLSEDKILDIMAMPGEKVGAILPPNINCA